MLIAGPRSHLMPFWSALNWKLNRNSLGQILKRSRNLAQKALHLLQLGVRSVDRISFILGISRDEAVFLVCALYRAGLIDRCGRPTKLGLKRMVRIDEAESFRLQTVENFSWR
jgi:predicted transcriptional regulator